MSRIARGPNKQPGLEQITQLISQSGWILISMIMFGIGISCT
jgi:hypothetical protein